MFGHFLWEFRQFYPFWPNLYFLEGYCLLASKWSAHVLRCLKVNFWPFFWEFRQFYPFLTKSGIFGRLLPFGCLGQFFASKWSAHVLWCLKVIKLQIPWAWKSFKIGHYDARAFTCLLNEAKSTSGQNQIKENIWNEIGKIWWVVNSWISFSFFLNMGRK